MTKSVTNQADPAAVPALASPDLATNIMRQLSHARLLAYDAADVAIYVLTENAVAGIIRDALHQEQNVMDVWQRTLADIIQKWTKEASCYVGGAMMDSPVGEMNRASATVIRAMLSDLKTLPLAVSRAGETWQLIETADIDMPVLVLDCTHHREPRVIAAQKTKHGEWLTVPGRYSIYPTHWMPLPDPPQDATWTVEQLQERRDMNLSMVAVPPAPQETP